MKKNRMMRLASVLLVLTLLSTSVISGTFAKYVTSDTAQDTARVAKFGVVVTASGSLFSNAYVLQVKGNTPTVWATGTSMADPNFISVGTETETLSNIVAPGTKSDKGVILSVAGQPEVATQLDVTVNGSDIYLKNGQYGVMVDVTETTTRDNVVGLYTKTGGTYKRVDAVPDTLTGSYYKLKDKATVAADNADAAGITVDRFTDNGYYPVIWNIGGTEKANVADVKSAVEKTETYNANTNLTATVGSTDIGWVWPFADATAPNAADTILGDLIAYEVGTSNYQVVWFDGSNYTGITVDAGTQIASAGGADVACLKLGLDVSATVTQVD